MLSKIYNAIKNGQNQAAFDMIIDNEDRYTENSMYWSLRGDICKELGGYEDAVFCYEKSLGLNPFNIYSLSKTIDIKKILNQEVILYQDMWNDLLEDTTMAKAKMMMNDLDLARTDDVLNYLSSTYFENENVIYLSNYHLVSNNDVFFALDLEKEYFNEIEGRKIIIPHNMDYVESVEIIAKYGMTECYIAIYMDAGIKLVKIDKDTMEYIANGNRDKTITMGYFNESDSNIFALKTLIPDQIKDKYNINFIKGYEVYSIENKVKVPLISKLTVSGHGIFTAYPVAKLTYNLEVGHGCMPMKACGVMSNNVWYASPSHFKNVDLLCVSSQMDSLLWGSFSGLGKKHMSILGSPRIDLLSNSNGVENLAKIIGPDISSKKIIFNMPTFNSHEGSGSQEGGLGLNDFIKIKGFDYKGFDKFLQKNNAICIFKVHHAEESIIGKKGKLNGLNNIYAISNRDLEKSGLDLYQVINAGDLLITDYSSIYSDFLFMDKPTVFVNTDIDEYRSNRGLALEPYDFWTAGPKVKTQLSLQSEIEKVIKGNDNYKDDRKRLKNVFFEYNDSKNCNRVWAIIDAVMKK